MIKKSSRTLPLFAALLLSQVTPSSGDPKTCAEDSIAMMQEDKDALGHRAVKMFKMYNQTCEGTQLCKLEIDEDTSSYIQTATSEEGEPTLPDVPIVGGLTAAFEGFSDHQTVKDYIDLCLEKGGFIKFFDVDMKLKGTAMELVDVDVVMAIKALPQCLHIGCHNEDYEEALEWTVKTAVMNNAEELSDKQKLLISSMNLELACAASGIEECTFTVTDTDSLGLSQISGAMKLSGQMTLILATTFGVLATIV